LKAPAFNQPLSLYKVKNWFQAFAFTWVNLYRCAGAVPDEHIGAVLGKGGRTISVGLAHVERSWTHSLKAPGDPTLETIK
jgi:hypothetical protein